MCAILYAAIRKHLSLIKGMKKLVERDVRYSFEARMQKLEGEKQRIRNCKAITEQEYLEKYARYTAGTSSRETFQEFRRVYLKNELLPGAVGGIGCRGKESQKEHCFY